MFGFGSLLKDYLNYYNISINSFSNKLNITDKELYNILNNSVGIDKKLIKDISELTSIEIKLIKFAEKQRIMYKYLSNRFKSKKERKKFLNNLGLKRLVKAGKLELKNSTNDIQNAIDLFEYLNIDIYWQNSQTTS